ncbi:MAG TPA: DUF6356 family protein [Burkholderiales bacterium]|nr:DUF6356 family protein [Burkholderiales bacterium]
MISSGHRSALAMVTGGLARLVHALLPFRCVRTGSGTVARLHERMITNRARVSSGVHDPTPRA